MTATSIPIDSTTQIMHKAASGGLHVAGTQELTSGIITLMGISFILGVLFTTFLLLVLDFMRRHAQEEK